MTWASVSSTRALVLADSPLAVLHQHVRPQRAGLLDSS